MSATNCASQSGRGPSKSSITHRENGSAITVSGSSGAGTIRSTTVHGKLTPAGAPSRSRSTSPLRGTLSHEITVSGAERFEIPRASNSSIPPRS